jgi:YHS domain-containing protein
MKRFAVLSLSTLVLGAFALVASVNRAEEEKKEEFKATCPVSGKAAIEDSSVEYKGGKVYFCCEGCPDAFKGDTAKFAAKANMQLVQTKQFVQEKCPLTGGKLNAEKTVDVGGAKVTFCCENCQGAVAKLKGDEQINKVFSDAAFKKAGFKKAAAE